MPPPYDLFGDTSGLPRTRRSGIRYEIESLTPTETWGAGSGATSVVCRVEWEDSVDWIKDMVGEVSVIRSGSVTPTYTLKRDVPEFLGFNIPGGTDDRVQFCTMIEQVSQGRTPAAADVMAQAVSNWPRTEWVKYRATFEAVPYAILDYAAPLGQLPAMADIVSAAGANAGAPELYRYVVRTRRTYSREQPIPAASTAGGFKVIDDVTAANRKPVGQVGFRVVSMADVTYKWVRVPVGWPPTAGYTGGTASDPWPPAFNPAATSPSTIKRRRDTYVGTVNSGWFDCAAADGYCFEPGTLLYKGYDDSAKYYDAAGQWVCDIVYTFQFKEGGWNKFLDASGNWKEVSLDGTSSGTKPYATSDFNNLFQYS